MKTQQTPLELLNKFLNKNNQKEVLSLLQEFDNKTFEGPTIEEYFDSFNLHYEIIGQCFSKNTYNFEKIELISDRVPIEMNKNVFVCIDSVLVTSNDSERISSTIDPNKYGQAA